VVGAWAAGAAAQDEKVFKLGEAEAVGDSPKVSLLLFSAYYGLLGASTFASAADSAELITRADCGIQQFP
jgi:hypothetical protein